MQLQPTLADRIGTLVRWRWARSALVRRLLAAALLAAAVVMALRGDPGADRVAVVVAARDLAPGRLLAAADVQVEHRPASTLPDGPVRAAPEVVGRTLAAPARRGEVLTDVRVVGTRLATAAAGSEDARVVPVRLADAGVAELLRAGDRVDVLTADDGAAHTPQTLAVDAAVVLVATAEQSRDKERLVMLALPAGAATTVAAASLTTALTVVFH